MSEGDFTAHVVAKVDTSEVDTLVETISNINNKNIDLTVHVNDSQLTKLTSSLNSLNSGKSKIDVDASGLDKVTSKTKEVSTSLKQLEKFNMKIDTHGIESDMSGVDKDIQKINTQMDSLTTQMTSLKEAGAIKIDGTEQLQSQLENLKSSYQELQVAQQDVVSAQASGDTEQMSAAMNSYNESLTSVKNQISTLKSEMTTLQPLTNEITNLNSQLANSSGANALKEQLDGANQAYEQLLDSQKQLASASDTEALNAGWESYTKDLLNAQQQTEQLKADMSDLATPLQEIELGNQIETWMKNNTKITKESKEALQDYVDTLKEAEQSGNNLLKSSTNDDATTMTSIKQGFKEIQQEETAAGNTGLSFMSQFQKSFERIGEFTGIYRITSQIPRLMGNVVSNVVDVNSALIELRKVSDATDTELSQSFEQATESATKYGAAISEVINSQADWARLGYSVPEADELADVTTLLQTVGDNMTQESSSEGLIAVLRGFQYDASEAESIVDIMNEVANNEPIDTSGLFDALERSASSLYAANNTLEESVALVTTANSVVQNPESVGTTFKTEFCLYVQKCA